jgi:protein SCO1/2
MINNSLTHQNQTRRAARFSALLSCAAAAFLFSGCGQKNSTAQTQDEGYALKGEILGIDAAHNQLTIKHEEVKGLMPAMTMEFAASPGDIANAKIGQHIHARLIPEKNGDFHVEKIWVDDAAKNAVVDAAAKALVQDTVALGNKAYHDVGDTSPDFALYDENGNVVQSNRFRGKQIMINFIFTRCPVPTMCPASVARFQSTQKMAREAGVKNLELISITLDPAYDTPGVLKTYTMARGIDTSNYSFLTGPENAIKSLLSQFGVLAYFQGPLLDHTLATLLIDENGKIIYRVDGSRWQPEDFIGKMKKT